MWCISIDLNEFNPFTINLSKKISFPAKFKISKKPPKKIEFFALWKMTKKKTTSEKQSTQSNNNNGSISKESMALAQILDDVQHSFARHAKHLVTVKKMLQEDELKFSDVFMPMLNQILPIYKREMSVERLVKFIVKIGDGSTDGKPNEKFALGLIRYLLNYVDAKDKGVRFRCLQMVAGLIAGVQGLL